MKKKKKLSWKKVIPFYVMVFPGLLYLIIDKYIPMFGVVIAFKRLNFAKGIWGSDWCGFDNFKFLFRSSDAWIITRNTILYNVAFFVVGTVMSILIAIMMNEIQSKKASKTYQTAILLPYLISWVVISYIANAFLATDTGLINNAILNKVGMEDVSWYSETKYWPYILVLVQIWKTIGYSMIIYYSNIVGISKDYFEAAMLDGASKWQQIKNITLPMLKPTVMTMLLLSSGQIMRSDFGLFYQVPKNSGVLYPVTRTIDVYVYQALMKNSDFGMSSAAGVYQSVIGLILIIMTNYIIKKKNPESAIF